tara:strand:- start:13 stop:354 length:342 start_codon:yes stop_codon:yes gene_type:complete
MQFYPQHFMGFIVNNETAGNLQLTEAFDSYEMSYDEDSFFDKFEESYGVAPYKFADTTYERGGYVQGLEGFEWDTTYICFHPTSVGDAKWENMISKLENLGIFMQEGRWSQLG